MMLELVVNSECLNSVANMKQIQLFSWPAVQVAMGIWWGLCALETTPGLFAFDLSWGNSKEEKRSVE